MPTEPTTTSSPSTVPGSATTTIAGDSSLRGFTIVLDPGHNGRNFAHRDEIDRLVDIGTGTKPCNTTGTSTDDGYTESRFNWEVAAATRDLTTSLGAEVVLTRSDDDGWGPCITERAAIGNDAGADAVISIHADGGPPEGRGFHVIHPVSVPGYTDDIADASGELARALHTAYAVIGIPVADYIGEGGFSERDDLGGLVLSDVPVVFLEAGNMRNPADAALLTDPSVQLEIASAITSALIAFLSTTR